jgi:hypothetical protein
MPRLTYAHEINLGYGYAACMFNNSGVAPSPANSRASLSALQRKVPDAQGSVNSTHGGAHSEPRAFFPAQGAGRINRKAAAQLMGPIRKPALPMNGTQPRPITSGDGAA